MEGFDIVTLTYSNIIDISLIKLQAMSMKYLDTSMVNNIFVVYNDKNNGELVLEDSGLLDCYPEHIRNKVKIIYVEDLGGSYKHHRWSSNWQTQQITKLVISKIILSKYYLILDSKNHFIRDINYYYFFNEDGKPYKVKKTSYGPHRWYNSLDYFGVSYTDTTNSPEFDNVTPFMMITNEVVDMIQYIEDRENCDFYDFFMVQEYGNKYTEFFLYGGYLTMVGKVSMYVDTSNLCSTIYGVPLTQSSSYEYVFERVLFTPNIKIMGLHRGSLKDRGEHRCIGLEYKQKIIDVFYPTFFNTKECNFIRDEIIFNEYK